MSYWNEEQPWRDLDDIEPDELDFDDNPGPSELWWQCPECGHTTREFPIDEMNVPEGKCQGCGAQFTERQVADFHVDE